MAIDAITKMRHAMMHYASAELRRHATLTTIYFVITPHYYAVTVTLFTFHYADYYQ